MARTNYFHSLFVFLLRRLLYPSSSYYRHLFFIVIWTIPINQHGRLTRSYGLLRTGVVFPIYKVKTRLQSIPSTDGRGAFAQASEIIKKEGFFNLYRGLQAELAGIGPVKASALFANDFLT